MSKSAIVTVDGRIEIKDLNGYDDLFSSVGGWLEALRFPNGMIAYLNEEGKLRNLPPNGLATYICNELRVGLSLTDYIVGNMVLVGPLDKEMEDSTDLTPEMIQELVLLQKNFSG